MAMDNRRNTSADARNNNPNQNFGAKGQRPNQTLNVSPNSSKKGTAANSANSANSANTQGQNQGQNQKAQSGQKNNSSTALATKAKSAPNFMESFSAPVKNVEHEVENFLTQKPLATVAIALAVGLVGGFIFKKYRNAESASNSEGGESSKSMALDTGASLAFAGFLTKGLSTAISRVESEFGAFRGGGIADVKESLTQIITDELAEKPFETIATAIGAGFGIANLETTQMKNGAIRIAKTLAVRTLEGSGSSSFNNNTQGENHVQA